MKLKWKKTELLNNNLGYGRTNGQPDEEEGKGAAVNSKAKDGIKTANGVNVHKLLPDETKGQDNADVRENPKNYNSKDENIENEKIEDTDNHVNEDEKSEKHVDMFEERPPILD